MVTHVMGTLPYRDKEGRYNAQWIRLIFERYDIKDWVVALEKGKGGYRHYQLRFDISGDYDTFFNTCKLVIPSLHLEKATNGPYENDYERKEGFFCCSRDTPEILSVRFGRATPIQRDIINMLDTQNDRQVDVWLDPRGNHGKSWLSVHMWERGQALIIPRSATTPEKLSAFVCSAWNGQPYIIIDIPRAQKIDPRLYETIEELKDGLVFDHRYSGRTRNVRGTKVCIFTNTPLDKKKLSHDRWRLHGIEERASRGSLLS